MDGECVFRSEGLFLNAVPAINERVHWLGRQRVLPRAGDIAHQRPRPDVDGQDFVWDRWPVVAMHQLAIHIQRGHVAMKEPRIGKACQGPEIDMGLVKTVMTGNETRQHARIGRVDIAADQGQADARNGFHPEPL